ncbi:MAG: hypothetical protein LUD69_05060 [Oscillospiraceae bacterium]|nr:hypothetical protein [Oscillospiraceae bacterium]
MAARDAILKMKSCRKPPPNALEGNFLVPLKRAHTQVRPYEKIERKRVNPAKVQKYRKIAGAEQKQIINSNQRQQP